MARKKKDVQENKEIEINAEEVKVEQQQEVKTAKTEEKPTKRKTLKPINKKYLIAGGALLTVIALLGIFHSSIFVATVGYTPILRSSVVKELEEQGAGQVLETMVIEKVILKEAAAQDIKAETIDIDNEITAIRLQFEEQDIDFDQLLIEQNYSEKELRSQIEVQILLEKMLGEKLDDPIETQNWIEEMKEKHNVRYFRYQ